MVGVVIAAHGKYAEALLETAEGIVGKLDRVAVVNLFPQEGLELARQKMLDSIRSVDDGSGVLLLADMFGGTPANCCVSLLDEGKLEVVTGVNLPMVLKLASARADDLGLRETAQALTQHGQRNVLLASDLIRERCRTEQGKASS